MFNTLYKKLAATLFVCIVGMGFILLYIMSYSARMYQQEVSQKLNADIAKQIVAEKLLMQNNAIDQNALKDLFHMLMVINPSIEVYLLDTQGKILAYSAPEEKIKRTHVSLKPIDRFLDNHKQLPLTGDDPRNPQGKKVFTTSPIYSHNELQGYLYVILGGEIFDGITAMIQSSYILQISALGIGSALIIALLSGLLLFFVITRRISKLTGIMSSYLKHGSEPTDTRYPVKSKRGDEIERLGENFNVMADRIDKQLSELKLNDAKRRELVANVSHDLRTPLTSLHGYLQTLCLKEDTLSAEERKRYLQIVIGQSDRLKHLITELFELAKLDSVETLLSVEPFSLAELIQDIAQKYTLIAKENAITLTTDFSRELPFVYGDIGLIQRALANLLDNALRYTKAGGEITLSLTEDHDNITVKITDTGCGIAQEEIPHIFDRFYRAKQTEAQNNTQDEQNSGLGLAITKKILSLHGSQIIANSIPDVGTTFTFHLPACQTN